jgi:hypothetical protein
MPLDQTPIIDALIQIVGEANLIQNEQDKARYLMDWRKQYQRRTPWPWSNQQTRQKSAPF